jgi:TetR/AcrR family transcriptional regulator, ethionamide resistance regulator
VPLSQEEVEARRFAARKREITERLLPVVEQKLTEDGSYVNLRLDQILQEALLSRSTFYRYFRDKNELLLALIDPVLDDVRVAATRPLDRTSAPTCEELRTDLRRNFDIYRPHIPLLNALVEMSYSDPQIRAHFDQGFAGVHETISRQIAYGQDAGFIRPDIRAPQTAAWITWMAERGMTQLVPSADTAERDRLADSLATMVWYTLYGGQP